MDRLLDGILYIVGGLVAFPMFGIVMAVAAILDMVRGNELDYKDENTYLGRYYKALDR